MNENNYLQSTIPEILEVKPTIWDGRLSNGPRYMRRNRRQQHLNEASSIYCRNRARKIDALELIILLEGIEAVH